MTEYNFNLITAFANSAPSNEIEAFPDYDRGLGIAFDETDGKPEMKGLNGLFSLLTVSLLALKQRGILTWTTGFEYKQGAFVVESNRLYQAKTDNTSKQPSLSQNDWQVWASVSDIDVDINGNIIKTAKAGGAFTLKVEDASTTVKGVARFATAIEIANKNNVMAAVTPKNVADMFVGSFTERDSITLPNGLILQWCKGTSTTVGDADFTVQFPKPFPNACLSVQVTTIGGAVSQTDGIFQLRSMSKASCVVNSQVFGTGSISAGITPLIFAIGN